MNKMNDGFKTLNRFFDLISMIFILNIYLGFNPALTQENSKSLEEAIEKKDLVGIIQLLEQGEEYDQQELIKKLTNLNWYVAKDDSINELKKEKDLNTPYIDFYNKLIFKFNYDPNLQDNEGWTMGMYVARYGQPEVALAISKLASFNPNLQIKNGWTMGMMAARHGQPEVALAISKLASFNPNLQKNDGWTMGILAAEFSQPNVLSAIIDHKNFDSNKQNTDGDTFGHKVAKHYTYISNEEKKIKEDIFNKLLNKGLNLNVKNKKNETILDIVKNKNHTELYKFLKNKILPGDDTECEIKEHYSHLTLMNFAEKIICQLCGSEEVAGFQGMASCECVLCFECNYQFLDYLVKNSSVASPSCPGCKKEIVKSYLHTGINAQLAKKDKNINPQALYKKLANHFHRQKLQKIPHFQFCLTEDCAGGKIVDALNSEWFSCTYCKKDSFLKGELAKLNDANDGDEISLKKLLKAGEECPPENTITDSKHPDYMKGRYRPCYHCGKITERIDGCNSMMCTSCKITGTGIMEITNCTRDLI